MLVTARAGNVRFTSTALQTYLALYLQLWFARLVNDYGSPGRYTINFDATGLFSGVNIYRIGAGVKVETRSMMIVK